jgi:hypothetical protein
MSGIQAGTTRSKMDGANTQPLHWNTHFRVPVCAATTTRLYGLPLSSSMRLCPLFWNEFARVVTPFACRPAHSQAFCSGDWLVQTLGHPCSTPKRWLQAGGLNKGVDRDLVCGSLLKLGRFVLTTVCMLISHSDQVNDSHRLLMLFFSMMHAQIEQI